jgi:hypothetical protein
MSDDRSTLSHHPSPHRDRVAVHEAVFGLFAGPLGWFLQLVVGFALASWPCFPNDRRLGSAAPGFGWTNAAAIAVMLVGLLLAVAGLILSWRSFMLSREEVAGGHSDLAESGAGRTRFLALWGLYLSGGFALVTALTLVAYCLVPRCAG